MLIICSNKRINFELYFQLGEALQSPYAGLVRLETVLNKETQRKKRLFSDRAPRKKCPYSELFWSVFSRIRTEYGYSISLRIHSECGKIRTKITPNKDTFYAVYSMSNKYDVGL